MQTTREKLSPVHQVTLRTEVERNGQSNVARRLGVSPQTVAALLAALDVHTAIVEMVERRLEELAKAETSDAVPQAAAASIQWPADWDPEEGWPEVGEGRIPDGARTWAEVDAILHEQGTSLEQVVRQLKGGT